MLLHEFRHVDSHQRITTVEEHLGKSFAQFRFTDASRTKKHKGTVGAIRVIEFQDVEEFRDAIVAYVAERPVYLRDVATVEQGYKDREAITRVNGQESVELAIYKEGDANTVQVAERVESRLHALRESLPDNIELITIYDQSTFISSAVSDVRLAAILGGLIAIFVLYGFLRDARATMIVGIAIPVSVIGTFLLMYTNQISLNIMSLGGIALAVGMLVDNSIVVLENIVRKREQGEGVVEAAKNGTTEVGAAVVAATLTTIAVSMRTWGKGFAN